MTTELSRGFIVYCYPQLNPYLPAEKTEFKTLKEAKDFAQSKAPSIEMYEVQFWAITLDTTKKNARPQRMTAILERAATDLDKWVEKEQARRATIS